MQEKQKKNCAAEVEKAVEMSQLSMETLAESKKRKSQRNDGKKNFKEECQALVQKPMLTSKRSGS